MQKSVPLPAISIEPINYITLDRLVLEKSQKVQETANNQKFDYSRLITLCKKLGVAAYAGSFSKPLN